MVKRKLKVEIIKGTLVTVPKTTKILDFVNSRDMEVVSIVFDGNRFFVYYYEDK